MERREILKWTVGAVALGVAGYAGLSVIRRFVPHPPKKILVKEKDLPTEMIPVKVGPEYFLVRLPGGKLLALSRRCPHLGCTVNYFPQKNLFICPCHQSRFALSGAYLSGPAPRGLYPLKWEKSEGGILLEIPG
ncbi:ubiquinol-cytochrome c reductase iron-sulfur subunit [Thermosulfurimonas marina]|uniref:Ubiquinol-cytochrome c reductase iron-sulfur subunit n=1 Tax=Thermosulfurimonas marina TaxID=2047767 RepID=A0A6H1WSU6_9BACT|nr:ubiquinol-cytochrome c reductase iron-sulfur subunit [Thermosulfurimonas marina]QJA06295.1 ubiquinol-cytochrome c reductase iron-sulfur subunit [Thermosulfurimonas marina]